MPMMNNETIHHAPEALRRYYGLIFRRDSDTVAAVFGWMEAFDDSMMTEGLHIAPLIKLANKGDTFAVIALTIAYNHHREPWLYERMGFHALAGIQGGLPDALRAFAVEVRP